MGFLISLYTPTVRVQSYFMKSFKNLEQIFNVFLSMSIDNLIHYQLINVGR